MISPTYPQYMVLSKIALKQITTVGITSKGAIYLTYTTEKGKGCSFVSFGELRTALRIDVLDCRILAEVARDRTQDLITYNHSFFPQQELDNYLEEQAAEIAPEYIFLQRQIEKAVAELNLTAQFIEDEGELFAKIYASQFLGIVNIDGQGKITIFSDRFKGKRVFSVAGAMTLIAQDCIPQHRSTDEQIAQQNRKFENRGAFVGIDGTVRINDAFYRRMGSVSQVGVYKQRR